MIEIDIEVAQGSFRLDAAFAAGPGLTALFGRSGSGKSTLIAAVAGLVRPARGRIVAGGVTLFDRAAGIDLAAHRRRIGLVFQDAQLLPHLNVRSNLFYGRWFARRRAQPLDSHAVIDVLGLGGLLERRPRSLSGGERQRVAIGRALLAAPRLLLMDEPLASLDAERKAEILPLIERLRDAFGIPILYVSHAAEEVARLAATVVMLEAGRVRAVGPPEAVLAPRGEDPTGSRFRAVSIIPARVAGHDASYGLTVLDHPAGPISVPGTRLEPGASTRVVVHGTDVSLARRRPEGLSIRTVLEGVVRATVRDEGPVARVDLALAGGDALSAFVTRKALDELGLEPGLPVFALIKAASIEGDGPAAPQRS